MTQAMTKAPDAHLPTYSSFQMMMRDAAQDYWRRAAAIEAMMRACDHARIDCADFERQAQDLRNRANDIGRFLSGASA